MATSYTSLLGLALPVTGELSGTWGDTVNNSITSLLDTAIAGAVTVSADTTLTTTDGASNQARSAIIIASGHVANITVTAPARSKIYTIINTSATYTVKIVGVGPTTGVTLGVSEKAQVAWNGSDFVRIGASGGPGVFSSITNTGLTSGRVVYSTTGGLETDSANLLFNGTTLTANTLNLTNALGTTYGGTGLTSFTSGGVVYASSGSALSTGSALTFDGTNLSVGGTASNQRLNIIVPVFTTSASGGMRIGDSGNNYYTDYLVKTDGSANPYVQWSFASHTLAQYWYGGGNNYWAWYANNSEAMRLTSTSLYTASGINVGIGTSSPSTALTIAKNGVDAGLGIYNIVRIRDASSNKGVSIGYLAGSNTTVFTSETTGAASAFGWETYSGSVWAQTMTLDSSGNLGIGTTSPVYKLSVNKGSTGVIANLTDGVAQSLQITTGSGYVGFLNPNYGAITFRDGGNATEFMRLDSSGNLGLGVTPSAWTTSSTAKAFEIGTVGNALYGFSGSNINLTSGAYYNSGWKYAVSSLPVSYYNQSNGVHAWFTAASGTAGNAITFTQAMTLDASGNLLVGETSGTGNGERIYAVTSTFVPFVGRHSSTSAGKFWFFGPNSGNNYVVQNQSSVGVYITDGGTSWTGTSDEHLKNITGTIKNGLLKIASLRAAEFTWKADDTNKPQVGLIAQDVQKVLPEVVDADAEGTLGVRYSEVIPLLVAGIQELKAEVDSLKTQLEVK